MSRVQALTGIDGRTADPDPMVDRHVHVVLLGLMGAGKSTVGRLLANELGRPFVDSDAIVELRTGLGLPEVVHRRGLHELHAAELAGMRQVLARSDSVVFAAAASVIDHDVADELAGAWCVWLDTAPPTLAARVTADEHDGNVRPLVDDDPEPVLMDQYRNRAARGREIADFTVTTDDRTAKQVVAEVYHAWCRWAERRDGGRRHVERRRAGPARIDRPVDEQP